MKKRYDCELAIETYDIEASSWEEAERIALNRLGKYAQKKFIVINAKVKDAVSEEIYQKNCKICKYFESFSREVHKGECTKHNFEFELGPDSGKNCKDFIEAR